MDEVQPSMRNRRLVLRPDVQEADSVLIERTLNGDREAFGELTKRYTPMVLGYLRKKFPSAHEVEDVLQEAFLRAYTQLDSLRKRERFRPWLLTIARNEMLDSLSHAKSIREGKSRVRNDGVHSVGIVGDPEDPGGKVSLAETQQHVIDAISSLSDKYQPILYMRIIDEEPLNEIAHRLGLKESTARMRLLRGLQKLRTRLNKQGITRHEGK